MAFNIEKMEAIAKEIRRNIIGLAHKTAGPHVGSCLSCADILTVLYCYALRVDPWEERDIFIMSKAHAAIALYSTLIVRGITKKSFLEHINKGPVPGHLDRFYAEGIETSAGALGHGFNIGLGMALGFKKKNNGRKVFVLIGDGESQEGSIWEGALFAPKFGLHNFTAIMDMNNLQGYGRPTEVCHFKPVKSKWESFGWHVLEVDGHDFKTLKAALDEDSMGKPKIILARTIKGKGVSFMEDELAWHYYIVTDEHKEKALKELS